MFKQILLTPLQKFIKIESFSGLNLMASHYVFTIKIGIIIDSIISGIVGYIILKLVSK